MIDNNGAKKVFVLGGSGGIGFEIAKIFAQKKYIVTISGKDNQKTQNRATELAKLCSSVNFICTEITDNCIPNEIIENVTNTDILVLAYGPFLMKKISDMELCDWQHMAEANYAIPSYLAGLAANAMAKRDGGKILLFGGTRTDAIRGYKTNAAYSAAKTALGITAKSIAVEFGNYNVQCSVVCPGFVSTEYHNETQKQSFTNPVPNEKIISSTEIASFCTNFLENGITLANGAIITVDKGLYSL